MAIIKVSQFNSAPTAVSDYEAQNAHIMAFINQVNSQAFILTNPTGTTEPTIKQDTYINHGGTLYTVDTADESITGSPADGNVYIKLSVSGDNLIASYVTDISSYTWNQVYGYLASGTDIILPYLLVKSGTSWTKYRMDIKTPQYVTDQNLRTTDAVDFASVNTGQGANKLYAMDQNVTSTSNVEFRGLAISSSKKGSIEVTSAVTIDNYSVLLPKGIYLFEEETEIYLRAKTESSINDWNTISLLSGLVISDGVRVGLKQTTGSSLYAHYMKFS
jgi:hypothetical protein